MTSTIVTSLVKLSPFLSFQVGARCLETAVFGAVCNVRINLKDIKDAEYVRVTSEEADGLLAEAERECKEVLKILEERSA